MSQIYAMLLKRSRSYREKEKFGTVSLQQKNIWIVKYWLGQITDDGGKTPKLSNNNTFEHTILEYLSLKFTVTVFSGFLQACIRFPLYLNPFLECLLSSL
jgi:hypothetical protein